MTRRVVQPGVLPAANIRQLRRHFWAVFICCDSTALLCQLQDYVYATQVKRHAACITHVHAEQLNVVVNQQLCQLAPAVLQPGMSLPDNIRSLFGAIPGAMPRGGAIDAMAGPGFITGAEANQTHAQAGTRAGGWAEGVGSSATAVNSLAGIFAAFKLCL